MLGDYVQQSVETQDPLELVCLLYAKAIERIKAARQHLQQKQIPERAQAIAHASQIVVELQSSLDAERGGEIAVNLDRVYNYIQESLVEANAQQKVEPLEVSLRLLETLYEGWQECRAANPELPERRAEPEPAPPRIDDSSSHAEPLEAVGAGSAPSRAWTL